jgi:hypothetical protein
MLTPDDGDGRSHSATEYAMQIGTIAARLDAIHEGVRDLVNKVGAQNGRIGKIEAKCAAHDSISISRTRTEMAAEGEMVSVQARLTDLETFRSEARGAGKATLGLITQLLTIAALVVSIWAVLLQRSETRSEAATNQHERLK